MVDLAQHGHGSAHGSHRDPGEAGDEPRRASARSGGPECCGAFNRWAREHRSQCPFWGPVWPGLRRVRDRSIPSVLAVLCASYRDLALQDLQRLSGGAQGLTRSLVDWNGRGDPDAGPRPITGAIQLATATGSKFSLTPQRSMSRWPESSPSWRGPAVSTMPCVCRTVDGHDRLGGGAPPVRGDRGLGFDGPGGGRDIGSGRPSTVPGAG